MNDSSSRSAAFLSDCPELLAFVRAVLGEVGLAVHPCRTWAEVIRWTTESRPAVLLVDLTIDRQAQCWSVIDGLAAVARLASLPIVVCPTTSWLLEGHELALRRPVMRVWPPPFDPAELLASVRGAISGGAPA